MDAYNGVWLGVWVVAVTLSFWAVDIHALGGIVKQRIRSLAHLFYLDTEETRLIFTSYHRVCIVNCPS